jgi:hypothetical protein
LILSVLALDGLRLPLTPGSWLVTTLLFSVGFSLCPRVTLPIAKLAREQEKRNPADWLGWAAGFLPLFSGLSRPEQIGPTGARERQMDLVQVGRRKSKPAALNPAGLDPVPTPAAAFSS